MEIKFKLGNKPKKAEEAIIELMFHYTILMEYSLLDLQNSVRGFVSRMSESVTQIDKIVTAETKPAQDIRVKIAEHAKNSPSEELANSSHPVAVAELLAVLAGVEGLNDKISPPIYTLIECLSFEDIQAQRIDHLTHCFKLLNEGIMQRLEVGLSEYTVEDIAAFSEKLRKTTRALYTMPEERNIFDQVFPQNPPKAV